MKSMDHLLSEQFHQCEVLMRRGGPHTARPERARHHGEGGPHGRRCGEDRPGDAHRHGWAGPDAPERPDAPHGAPDHLGRGQGRLLALLAEQDGLPQREVVMRLDIRPSSAGELIAKLEARGYVARRENLQDRRSSQVFLTDAGREALERQPGPREGLFACLTEEEQLQLSTLLGKVIDALRAQEQPGPRRGRED